MRRTKNRKTPFHFGVVVSVLVMLFSCMVPFGSIGPETALAGVHPSLPDWSKAGYRGGQTLPTGGTVINLTAHGVIANDDLDDSAALQQVIDDIRSGNIRDSQGNPFNESNRAILQFPAGQIDLSQQIRVDANGITLRGAGNDPQTGTKIVFHAPAIYTVDNGRPVIDGKLWPGYAVFRVETREKHPNEPGYEGSVNFHWQSGVRVASSGGGNKGDTTIRLASGAGSKFQVGDSIFVGAANTVDFYQMMQAPQVYWENGHMRSQIFTVTAVQGDTLTIDKPLEFDIPYSNDGQIAGTTYYSKVMPITIVSDVGFEDFYLTQSLAHTPYAHLNADDYDAVSNPNGVGLKYTNAAPEYAFHGILFKWAKDSWVKGVRTHMTGSHPIVTEFARNIEIRDNIIFGSWNKGKGGHGYVRGSKMYDSKIVGNKIDRVRHLTLQWSASGNVVADNVITVDMNLHGGWERRNLIERNTITVPYEHRSWGEGEGGSDPNEGTWYPIWWGAAPHASKWSGATGEQNVFFNNTMKKQETKGGSYHTYTPYDSLTTIYQFGWNGSGWAHLQKPIGTFISTWTGNEKIDFSRSPNAGVDASLTYTGSSLLGMPENNEPPTAPQNLTANAVSHQQIDLTWSPSSDNLGVAGYKVYRDGQEIADVTTTSYSDKNVVPKTTYSYTVRAYDGAQNVSDPSNTAQATTPAAPAEGPIAFTGMVTNNGSTYKELKVSVNARMATVKEMTFRIIVNKQGKEYYSSMWAKNTGNFNKTHSNNSSQIVYTYTLMSGATESGRWSFHATYKLPSSSGATTSDDTWEVTYRTSDGRQYSKSGSFDGTVVR